MRAWQGREAELGQLEAWLVEPEVQIVGIKAAGGFGKSALAKKLAEKLQETERFEQVLALTFGQVYPFAVWGRWLMAHFGQRVEDGVDDRRLVQRVVQQLEAVRCLLILDNVETLLTADSRQWVDGGYGEFWVAWLSASGPSVVLVTSRE
ncbi:MAG: NB-ARC domain-containing protein, partial [Phormidesmis sp.]